MTTITNTGVTTTDLTATSLKTPLVEFTDGDDAIAISDTGIVTFPNQIAFAATNTGSSQTINSGAWTKITFASAELNRGNAYNTSNSRFTPPVDGIYHFTTIGNFSTMTGVGGYIYFGIRKNGTVELYTTGMRLTSSAIQTDTQLNGCYMLEITTSDYIEFWAYCDPGSGSTASLTSARNKFQGFLVG